MVTILLLTVVSWHLERSAKELQLSLPLVGGS